MSEEDLLVEFNCELLLVASILSACRRRTSSRLKSAVLEAVLAEELEEFV